MRTFSLNTAIAIITLSLSSMAFAQQKIAVVDLEKLIRLHPNTSADKELLAETLKDYTDQMEQVKALAVSTRKAFEEAARAASNPALSESARKTAEEDALKKRDAAIEADRNATEKVRELQKNLTDQEIRMLKRTKEIIERAISAYAKGNGIDLVLELPPKNLGGVSSVLYANPTMDITPQIMELLDIKDEPQKADQPADEGEKAKE